MAVARGRSGCGHMGEGNQKVQISSYKIDKTQDVMYSMIITLNNIVLKVAKRVDGC